MSSFVLGHLRRRAGRLPRRSPGDARSILLVECTHLGDLLAALPAVRTLKNRFPHNAVRLVCRAEYAELAALAVPDVDVDGIRAVPSLRALAYAIHAAHDAQPDLACSLSPGKFNALTVLLSRAPSLAGYLEGFSRKTPFLRSNLIETFGIEPPLQREYGYEPLAGRAAKVLDVLGIPELVSPYPLRVGRRPNEKSSPADPPVVVIHPFARWTGREYPVSLLAETIRRILQASPARIMLLSTPKDGESLDTLQEALGPEPRLSACVSGDLLEIAYNLSHAALFVGTDSGPLHLAVSLDVPSIGLYGPVDPAITRPFGAHESRFTPLFHRLDCSPCDQHDCVRPAESCMRAITPDELAGAVLARLPRSPAGAYHA